MTDFVDLKPEGGNRTWTYENHLKNYLLVLGRLGKDGLERRENFPRIMTLSRDMNLNIERIRIAQRDGHERYALLGYSPQSSDIIFPSKPAKGDRDSISTQTVVEEMKKMKDDLGVVAFVGDIHSHPSARIYYPEHWAEDPATISARLATFVDKTGKSDLAAFSPQDLYSMMSTRETYSQSMQVMGVVQGRKNLFAFATRETFSVKPNELSWNAFEAYWVQKLQEITSSGETKVDPIWELNLMIAKAHNLVLYKGNPGEVLVREI